MTEFVQLNGERLELDDPGLLRATSYGHFTSMQVRDGRVRGLDLHLERLDRSSLELFGHGVAPERSLSCVQSALRSAFAGADSGDLSIRVTAFSRQGAKVHDGIPVEPDLLVTVTDPVEPTPETLRLIALEHERAVPHCFAGQGHIIWPAAAVLPGITMLVLKAGLTATGVPTDSLPIPLADLGTYDAAYLTNSIDAALPVASITTPAGTTSYSADPASAALIANAYEAIPAQPLL